MACTVYQDCKLLKLALCLPKLVRASGSDHDTNKLSSMRDGDKSPQVSKEQCHLGKDQKRGGNMGVAYIIMQKEGGISIKTP